MRKQKYNMVGCLLCLVIGFAQVRAQDTAKDASFTVQGEVLHSMKFLASDLAKMKRVEASIKDGQGPVQVYSGVALSDILQQAGASLGKQLRGENMSKYLLVKSGDGYEVLFSLPELDSAFSDRTIFLADQLDGKPLPQGKGPFRIIVPGEKKHARWIWEVRSLTVGFAKE
jgi:hypothetical protein